MTFGSNLFYRPALLCCFLIVFWAAGGAHGGQPASPMGPAAAGMQTLSGQGELFEVILKFPASFAIGSDVSLVAYVLDGATNEPVRGATVSGGMSSGAESIAVPFTEAAQAIAGAYQGKIRVVSDKPSSWLFDIALGEKNDLVAIDGFKAGEESMGAPAPVPPGARETGYAISLTPVEIAVLLAAFAVLQAAIFFFLRKIFTSSGSTEDSR